MSPSFSLFSSYTEERALRRPWNWNIFVSMWKILVKLQKIVILHHRESKFQERSAHFSMVQFGLGSVSTAGSLAQKASLLMCRSTTLMDGKSKDKCDTHHICRKEQEEPLYNKVFSSHETELYIWVCGKKSKILENASEFCEKQSWQKKLIKGNWQHGLAVHHHSNSRLTSEQILLGSTIPVLQLFHVMCYGKKRQNSSLCHVKMLPRRSDVIVIVPHPLLVVGFVILKHQRRAPDLCRNHTCEQCYSKHIINTESNKSEYRRMTFCSNSLPIPAVMA